MGLCKSKIESTMLAAAVMVAASVSAANAAVIWSNDITGSSSDGNPYTLGDSSDPNISVSGIGAGGGVGTNAGGQRYNFRNWTTGTGYFQWTLTPDANYEIDFTSLAGQWQRSSTGPDSYILRSSLDGFASNVASGAIGGSGSAVLFDLNLSAAAFDHVDSAITFRLFATGASGAAGTFSINNFAFDGTVSESEIPEPASLGLLGVGGLALIARRWRKSLVPASA